jgi:hypothetical protein
MQPVWSPRLDVTHAHGRCRLRLAGYAHGDGDSLQDAADALVARLLHMAMSWRSGAVRFAVGVGAPDVKWFEFLHELGEIAAAGGDIRDRVFGFPPETGSAD